PPNEKAPVASVAVWETVVQSLPEARWSWTAAPETAGCTVPRAPDEAMVASMRAATSTVASPARTRPDASRYDVRTCVLTIAEKLPSAPGATGAAAVQSLPNGRASRETDEAP